MKIALNNEEQAINKQLNKAGYALKAEKFYFLFKDHSVIRVNGLDTVKSMTKYLITKSKEK